MCPAISYQSIPKPIMLPAAESSYQCLSGVSVLCGVPGDVESVLPVQGNVRSGPWEVGGTAATAPWPLSPHVPPSH